jgi:hypothetical protein
MQALDYLLFQYLAKKGYRSVHMGASRPFLRDGALNYRKRLGMRLTDHGGRWFALRYRAESPGTRAFLASSPFVHTDGQRLKGAVFADPTLRASKRACAKYRAQHEFAGLSEITLYPYCGPVTIGDGSSGATEAAGAKRAHRTT